jgi:hypothetical protein
LRLNLGEQVKPSRRYGENHPACLMWRGYEAALATYNLYIISEWKHRGYKDNQWEPTHDYWTRLKPKKRKIKMPPWFYDVEFHNNQKEILVFKAPEHYDFEGIDQWFERPPTIWPVIDDNEDQGYRRHLT